MAKAEATKVRTTKAIKVESKTSGYRVYRIGDGLREAIKKARARNNVCTRELIESAVSGQLPVILDGLIKLGLAAKVGQAKRPARWQVSDDTLGALKVASAQCGLPASTLLTASLSLLCGNSPRKARKVK